MPRKKESFAVKFTACILTFFAVTVGVLAYLGEKWSTKKVCTVKSSQVISDFSGGTPASFLTVQTEECGTLHITNPDFSGGMNQQALNEFFKEHYGEKFEFVIDGISLGNNSYGSAGITSTTPVK